MSMGRNAWLSEQDSFLRLLIDLHGPSDWKMIGKLLTSNFPHNPKSGKKCRERWKYRLQPNIKQSNWTEEEKQLVFKLHQEVGNNWSEISKQVEGRTDNSIKNLFYCELKKAVKMYNENRKGNLRIQRTRKSLIQDKEITKVLNMAREDGRNQGKEPDQSQYFNTNGAVNTLQGLSKISHF